MTIRPGRNFVYLCLACCLLATLTPAVPVLLALIVLLLFGGVVLAIFEWFDLRAALQAVSVRRELRNKVGRGVPFANRLTFTSNSTMALRGKFRDLVPPLAEPARWSEAIALPQSAAVVVEQNFSIAIRGQHEFGPVWLRLSGRWNLLEAQRCFVAPGPLSVLPEGWVADDEFAQDTANEVRHLDKLLNSRQRGAGTEFAGLAEYRDGDDPRRMDWRATVRLRRPIVRQYQQERHRDVMIVLDCGRLMGAETPQGTKLDRAVDAALMLARVALKSGDRCGLAIYSDKVNGYLRPIAGMPALRAMAQSIYALQPNFRESNFSQMFAALQARQSKRSLMIVLSDIVDSDTTQQLQASLYSLAQRHIVLFAALQTPLLESIAVAPVNTFLDATRKAVVFRNQRDREKALHALRHGGVQVLDVAPSQLTVRLINRFIELRAANRL